jgi:hypothetical protein
MEMRKGGMAGCPAVGVKDDDEKETESDRF